MTGKTHLSSGIAVGAAFGFYGLMTGNPECMMALVSVPVGVMLPDGDHHNTALGKQRKKVNKIFNTITNVVAIGTLLAVIGLGIYNIRLLFKYLPILLGILVPIILSIYVRYQFTTNKKYVFYRKHRGIMHTLVVPAIIIACSYMVKEAYLFQLLFNLAIGYTLHLIGDSCTTEGCPLLYPLTKENMHMPLIKATKKTESFVAMLLTGGIIWIRIIIG